MKLGFLLLACVFANSPAIAGDFFSQFPQTEEVTLSTGERVPLPTHFYEMEAFNIIASADLKVLRSIVGPHGYQPTKFVGDRGMVFISIFFTSKHTFGPHNDIGFNIVVDGKDTVQGPKAFPVNHTVSWKIFGDLDVSNTADREIWKAAKEKGELTLEEDLFGKRIRLRDARGPIAEFYYSKTLLKAPVPLTMKAYSHSLDADRTYAPLYAKGWFTLKANNPICDFLTLDANHPVAKELARLDLQPMVWQHGSQVQAAFLAPRKGK